MTRKTTVIKNKTGLHARPAAKFIQTAVKFKSEIIIRRLGDNEEADAKKIIFLLSLGLCQGESIEIITRGEDEQEALDTLITLIDSGFEE